MDKKALWKRVCKTDPAHVKPITGKQYSGNSPKPYYIVERLTEEFGPCGTGWGFTIISERMERLSEDDVLHIAHVRLWYVLDSTCPDQRAEFDQMGQTKACYRTSKGTLLVDEDAPKKSVTDALVKCASYLGFAGDIFSGRWDDSKYVADLRKEFSLEEQLKASIEQAKARPTTTDNVCRDAFGQLQPEIQDHFRTVAPKVDAMQKDVQKAIQLMEIAMDDWPDEDRHELKKGLWYLLDSKTRSAISAVQKSPKKETA